MNLATGTKQWIKQGGSPLARTLFRFAKTVRGATLPSIPALHRPLYVLHVGVKTLLAELVRIFWTTPLFKSQVNGTARGLYLYSGLPLLIGPLDIELGDNIRLSGMTTLSGRGAAKTKPVLKIGEGTGIGWQTTIAVGTKVIIGKNVRIAGRGFLAGYPGHPVDANARARGLPDTDEQCGDIILEDDVWLATGVTVMAGVTIGSGSIIAAGSVVTKDIPAGVLAGGMPARVIRSLEKEVS